VTTVHYRYATVQARRLFYREAGPRGAPDVVLLHGFPASSFMFRDLALVSRPGNDLVQLALFADYATNLPLYPKLHAYLRDSGVPLLAVWGRNDQIFVPEGALAFAGDAPAAEIHLLDGGHFLLESHLDAAAGSIRRFLDRTLP
jgi:pimeloyl-ACP methyl ester carboxylesterase